MLKGLVLGNNTWHISNKDVVWGFLVVILHLFEVSFDLFVVVSESLCSCFESLYSFCIP